MHAIYGLELPPKEIEIHFPELWKSFIKWAENTDFDNIYQEELENIAELVAITDAFEEKFGFKLTVIRIGEYEVIGGEYLSWEDCILFIIENGLVINPALKNIDAEPFTMIFSGM